jgi:hypothetical protein
MNVPVFWYLGASQWDTALPKYILDRAVRNCLHYPDVRPTKCDVGVIGIPGRHATKPENYVELNAAAKNFKKAVFVIIGDEEGIFHSDHLEHPNMKIWWLMPPFSPKQKVDRVGPNGWPTGAPEMIDAARRMSLEERPYLWHFEGQMTHSRRIDCVRATQGIPDGRLLVTEGFTQGEPRENYYASMVRSKFVLCPAGPCTPDSFRFAEALEAGCVPVVDNRTQHNDYPEGYWWYLFGKELPFPIINQWSVLPELLESLAPRWEELAGTCSEWWEGQKQKLIAEMREDVEL